MAKLPCLKAALCAVLSLMVGGCATVATKTSNGTGNAGISYHLPEAWVKLTVVETDGVLTATVTAPVMAPDPDYRLTTHIPPGAFSDNKVTITVTPKTNLLSTFSATSVGRANDIVTGAIKSALNLQASGAASGTIIFDKLYRYTDAATATADADTQIRQYIAGLCSVGQVPATLKERCDRLKVLAATGGPLLQLMIDDARPNPASVAVLNGAAIPAECERGLCYRPMIPIRISLLVGTVSQTSDIVLVPDRSAVNWVSLPSGVFATQKYNLSFTEGVMTSYEQDGQSELVGLVRLPLTVVSAIISAPAEALGLKKTALEAETNYLTAVGNNAEKVKAVGDLCNAGPARCPETAAKIIRGATADPEKKDDVQIGGGDGGGPPINPGN
ncbi:hypothetical protein [Sphingopyxis sp. PET50]|uniref:hypothetical protein n=1 Tax=Sphingopyxis sp. PET50 TaxID=2976533 RepID=UPI0021AE470E|nr:hypothetical protein [Sphingopyxis sp. PET50]